MPFYFADGRFSKAGVELLFLAILIWIPPVKWNPTPVKKQRRRGCQPAAGGSGDKTKSGGKLMEVIKKIRLLLVTVLIMTLVVPRGVFATTAWDGETGRQANQRNIHEPSAGPNADEGRGVKYRRGEILFKTNNRAVDLTVVLKKYRLRLLRRDAGLGYVLASTEAGTDVEKLAAKLKNDARIHDAQPNYIYELSGVSDDPQYYRQWALPRINADKAWSAAKAVSPVTIAILDSGIDVNHPDLKDRIVPGINTINPLKSARDDVGHGTHVAGIAAASLNNRIGVAGVAGIQGIKIMPVKVFDQWGGSDVSISDGIIWAADHGARVINMSFGSFYQSGILNDAIDYAYAKGVVMVAAAGNWASQEISYPAALSKVMAISAIDRQNQLADFSSYGPQIDVCAPGEDIYSTYWDLYKGSTYAKMSGTSMASPMVAGLAAMLLAKNPKLTNDDVRQIIEVSATDLGDSGWDPRYGHGRIDVYKALTMSLKKIDDANGSPEKAVSLTPGMPYQEKISSGDDVDWYKVMVPDNGHLQVEVLPAGKVSPGVEIYDSGGTVVASLNNAASIQAGDGDLFGPGAGYPPGVAQSVYGLVTGLAGGEYYLRIFGNHFRWSNDNYTITAEVYDESELVSDPGNANNSFDKAEKITVGETLKGAILNCGEEDWFKVSLSGGKAYKFHVDVPAGLDLAVDVESEVNFREPATEEEWKYYFEHQFMATINNGGQGQGEDGVVVIPGIGSGTYYVRVYETAGAAINANYFLDIRSFDFKPDTYERNDNYQQAAPIKIGETISANFDTENDNDWYVIEVPAAGILKFDLDQPANAWCGLELYDDPQNEQEGGDYSGFGPDSGWDTGLDQIHGHDHRQRSFEFKVTPGKQYIKVSNYGNMTAEDYVIRTAFNTVDFVDAEINDTPLKADVITLDKPAAGTLYPEGDIDFYTLDITTPQSFLVQLTPPADLNTSVTVSKESDSDDIQSEDDNMSDNNSADGSQLLLEQLAEINTGGMGEQDTGVFVASKPGRYYLAVAALEDPYQGSFGTKSMGRYNLTVKPFTVTPDAWENNFTFSLAKPLVSGAAISPTFMGIEDIDWYKIYIPGKGKLKVNLSVPADIDGVLEIYNDAGKLLKKVDESMVGEPETAELPVLKKGYYYIKTYDYLGNSSVQTYSLMANYSK